MLCVPLSGSLLPPRTTRRAIEYCDGWFPHAVRPAYGNVLEMFPQFRQMAAEAGRDADSIPITVYGVARDLDLLARYRDAGTARVVFELPSAGPEEILPLLDEGAELARQI